MPDLVIELRFVPPLGVGVTGLIVAAALAAVAWYLWRAISNGRQHALGPVVLRLGALAVLFWVLAGPGKFIDAGNHAKRLPVVFLIDTSASMQHRDVSIMSEWASTAASPDGQVVSRWEAIELQLLIPGVVERLREQSGEVQFFRFDQQVRATSLQELDALQEPDGLGTDLIGALERCLSQTRVAAHSDGQVSGGVIVLVSDGHDTERGVDEVVLGKLNEAGWRVVTVPIGRGGDVSDIVVTAWAAADFLLEGQSTWIEAAVSQNGLSGRRVRVELFEGDSLIESKEMGFEERAAVRCRFRVTPTVASGEPATLRGYRVVASLVGETGRESSGRPNEEAQIDNNNNQWVFVEVSSEPIKAALFEGHPYWDTKFLARVLRRDPQIDLTEVYAVGPDRVITVIESDRSSVDGDPIETLAAGGRHANARTLDQTMLNGFDVVILGRGMERFFGGQRAGMLVDYVTGHGGALVMARGRAFDADTDQGRDGQALFRKIEPVEWGDQVIQSMPAVPAGSDAAVVYQNAGRGRVLAVRGEGMWRWALPETQQRSRNDEAAYQRFWVRVIEWLAAGGRFPPGRLVSLKLSKLAAEPGESVAVTVSTRYPVGVDFEPRLLAVSPAGGSTPIALTRVGGQWSQYTGTIKPREVGVYELALEHNLQATDGEAPSRVTTRLAVYDRSVERLAPSARPEVMAAISQATGGVVVDHGDEGVEALIAFVGRLREAWGADRRFEYVFDRPEVFALVVVLLGTAWLWQRRKGLA